MRVLVACEESQRVCIEFRKLGYEAYSCDIEPCSGGFPEWHIQSDVLPLLNGSCDFKTADSMAHRINEKWDMIIAFPPCTYMANSGAVRMRLKGEIVQERYQKAMNAKAFFMQIMNADCERIAIENPTPIKLIGLPPYTQAIQPYQFGHSYSKRTCLWLKGLPKLEPTEILEHHEPYVNGGCKDARGNYRRFQGRKERDPKTRAKTFPGIARAMAKQWGGFERSTFFMTDKVEKIPKKDMNVITVDTKTINKHLKALDNIFDAFRKDYFFTIGFGLYWFDETRAYQQLDTFYLNIAEFAKDRYGISKATTYQYLAVIKKFGKVNSKTGEIDAIQDEYKDYKSTALIIMAGMTDKQLARCNPSMKTKELKCIRDDVPFITDKQNKDKQQKKQSPAPQKSNTQPLFKIENIDDFEKRSEEILDAIKKVLMQNNGTNYHVDINMTWD